jgi:hypothetical protein
MTIEIGRGRPSHTPLKKAVSDCVKNTEILQLLEKEFHVLVGLGDDEEKNEDLMEVVDGRKCLAEEKDELTKKIRQFSLENDLVNKEKYTSRRKKLDAELREWPPLGYTVDGWKLEASDSDKDIDRGRPTLELEVKLVRAEHALRDSRIMAESLLKKDNLSIDLLDGMIEIEMSKEIKPGRPKSDELGRLDKKLLDAKRKITYIESGEAKKEREDKAVYSKKGALKGRTPKPLDEFLLDYQDDENSIKKRIKSLESKLDANGKLNRELKVLRDQKRKLKKSLNENNLMTDKELKENPKMAIVIERENILIAQIQAEDGSLVTERPLVSKTDNKAATKIAKSKKIELSKNNAEMDVEAEQIDDQEQNLLRQLEELRSKRAMNG